MATRLHDGERGMDMTASFEWPAKQSSSYEEDD